MQGNRSKQQTRMVVQLELGVGQIIFYYVLSQGTLHLDESFL